MTTRRNKRASQDWGGLKAALVVGSLAATLAGTRLLALQELGETAVSPNSVQTVPIQEPVVVVVPAPETEPLPMPPNWSGEGSRGTQVELAPVPKAITPQINPVQQAQPVARSRSSK